MLSAIKAFCSIMFTHILWALALLQFSYIRPPAHTPVSRLTIPHSALIRNRTEEEEKDGESGALSRRNPDRINYNNDSKLANITEKWDVPGSPSKPEQTGVTSKIKPIFKNRNENLTFFMRIFEKINVGWKNALKINQHFNLAYIPSPRVNHYNSGTVANSIQAKSSYKMVDFLSLPKILPSFNIGVILALIQCFLIKYRGKRMCYSTEKEVQCLKRGSTLLFMFSCIKCVAYKILFYQKGKSTKRRISVYPPTNISAVSRPKVSPKIKKSRKHFHDYSQVYDLCQFFESCTVSPPSPTDSVELEVRVGKVEKVFSENEYDYDVYDHLDTVPIPMPEPLSWKDYIYYPNHCNVIYAAPQESNSPQMEKLLTSLSTSVAENIPNNVYNTMINDSIPHIPPSFQNSVTSQGKKFESIIPQEIKEIISSLPHDSGQTLFNFIMVLGTSPKPLIDKLLQENSELRQLQKDSAPNTQQMIKIMELTEQVQSLTTQNEVMNKIIDTQIPLCTAKFNTSTQTNSTPEITVNKIVPKYYVNSDSQTLTAETTDFSTQVNTDSKENTSSDFQCQVSLSKLPHLTQETQTQPVKSVDFCIQTNITDKPGITHLSQHSLLETESQQLKEDLSQLQSEYSSLQELYENLDGKYQEALEYGAKATIQIEDQSEEIAQLQNQLVTLQEKFDKLKEQENLVCDKYNSLIPQFNLKISAFQKIIKDLHHDNYLLNNGLKKISPESDLNNRLNSSVQSDESGKWVMVEDSASQTDSISSSATINSKVICTESSVQATLTQSNINSVTQTTPNSYHTPSFPNKKTKYSLSQRKSPQSHITINQVNIIRNFKNFKCAFCSEEKHAWDKCKQWNTWNLPQKQQALQILDKAKGCKSTPTVSKRPNFHSQQKSPFNPSQVKINRVNFSKVQWEKQMKINENVKNAGLVKISSSFYVPQYSAVKQGVKSSSLRRGRTTPNSK